MSSGFLILFAEYAEFRYVNTWSNWLGYGWVFSSYASGVPTNLSSWTIRAPSTRITLSILPDRDNMTRSFSSSNGTVSVEWMFSLANSMSVFSFSISAIVTGSSCTCSLSCCSLSWCAFVPWISACVGLGLMPLMDNGILYSQYPRESAKSVTEDERNVMSFSLFILIRIFFIELSHN